MRGEKEEREIVREHKGRRGKKEGREKMKERGRRGEGGGREDREERRYGEREKGGK